MPVTYVPSLAYPTIQGATVSYAGGQTFNIKQALTGGGGSFTVDDSTVVGMELVDELDRHPAVRRSGTTSPSVVQAQSQAPVYALGRGQPGQLLMSQGNLGPPIWMDGLVVVTYEAGWSARPPAKVVLWKGPAAAAASVLGPQVVDLYGYTD